MNEIFIFQYIIIKSVEIYRKFICAYFLVQQKAIVDVQNIFRYFFYIVQIINTYIIHSAVGIAAVIVVGNFRKQQASLGVNAYTEHP